MDSNDVRQAAAQAGDHPVLENAARHAPPGSTVRVDGAADDDGVELVVADDGPGFPPDSRSKLFEPFAMATGAGSSGIGLAISRSIVEAHGGTITAGDAPGGGAVVTIALPRAPSAPPDGKLR